MNPKREFLSFGKYVEKIIIIVNKYNLETEPIQRLINSYNSTVIYSSPEAHGHVDDRYKHMVFNHIYYMTPKFTNDIIGEFAEFFDKYK